MSRTFYRTATTMNGFIADECNSLSWLFAVEESGADEDDFLEPVGVIIEGSTTYEWVLNETDMLAKPEQWQQYYGTRPTFVFTSRDLPTPAGADVRFRCGALADHLDEIRAAAAGQDIWVAGGGDLAGQFLDVDALDEIVLTVAPAALAAGAPLLPRRVESDRLTLQDVVRQGQFVNLTYRVVHSER
jgi:dihydrofolate reductase